ncbi:MAG: type II toxin-antitoxin system RelE family toxin [Dehalococcoidia bacterium]
MEVIWSRQAQANLAAIARIDRPAAERIIRRVEAFAGTRRGDVRKLHGSADEWRLRSGEWRAVFAFQTDPLRIEVLRVANRRDAYR